MNNTHHITSRLMRAFAAAFGIALLGLVGCGPTTPLQPEIKLEISKQMLEDVVSMKLMVIELKRKDNDAVMSCQGLLEKKFSFDPEQFTIVTEKILVVSNPNQTVQLDKLATGDKIFIAAGYSANPPTDAKSPEIIGCDQARIEAGKKAVLSMVMVAFK